MSTLADLPAGWKILHDPKAHEQITPQGTIARMAWYGPWESRHDFTQIVCGLDEEIEWPGGVTVTRRVPLRYPDTRYDNMYAVAVDMEGMGRSSSSEYGITYDYAKVGVTFQSQSFYTEVGDYPLISIQRGGGADIVTVPGTAYEFPSDSLRLDHNAGVLVPTQDFSITFHNLPTLDDKVEVWDGLSGHVNSDDFYVPNRTNPYTSGYVQFLTYTSSSVMSVGNSVIHTATLTFRRRRVKHNEVMRPDGAGFEAPELVGGSTNLLPTAALMGVYV